jgi:acetolactate synthase-1/2/3 large subunit
VKLARPKQPVVTLIGDGAYLYNATVQGLGFARDEKLPTMAIVYNNKGYRAMRDNQSSYYPEGAGVKHKLFFGEPINGFAFEELPKLFGGTGFRVETLDQLRTALKEGAAAMEKGQSVVINAILSE